MPVKPYSIRPMRSVDVPDVARLIRDLAASFGDKAQVREQDLRTYCLGRKKLSSVLLAIVAGKPVGFAIMREWMNFYLGAKFRHIDFVFVSPEYRKRGIASALIKMVAQRAERDGCRVLDIQVGYHNHDARNLYESLGFEKKPPSTDHYRLYEQGLKKLGKK